MSEARTGARDDDASDSWGAADDDGAEERALRFDVKLADGRMLRTHRLLPPPPRGTADTRPDFSIQRQNEPYLGFWIVHVPTNLPGGVECKHTGRDGALLIRKGPRAYPWYVWETTRSKYRGAKERWVLVDEKERVRAGDPPRRPRHGQVLRLRGCRHLRIEFMRDDDPPRTVRVSEMDDYLLDGEPAGLGPVGKDRRLMDSLYDTLIQGDLTRKSEPVLLAAYDGDDRAARLFQTMLAVEARVSRFAAVFAADDTEPTADEDRGLRAWLERQPEIHARVLAMAAQHAHEEARDKEARESDAPVTAPASVADIDRAELPGFVRDALGERRLPLYQIRNRLQVALQGLRERYPGYIARDGATDPFERKSVRTEWPVPPEFGTGSEAIVLNSYRLKG